MYLKLKQHPFFSFLLGDFQKCFKSLIKRTPNSYRVVSPILARRPNRLKIDNLWKTQIQKFKTPKQAIKFV